MFFYASPVKLLAKPWKICSSPVHEHVQVTAWNDTPWTWELGAWMIWAFGGIQTKHSKIVESAGNTRTNLKNPFNCWQRQAKPTTLQLLSVSGVQDFNTKNCLNFWECAADFIQELFEKDGFDSSPHLYPRILLLYSRMGIASVAQSFFTRGFC